ncbi:MAG: ATP-binding protein [Planctomycetota bacterium]
MNNVRHQATEFDNEPARIGQRLVVKLGVSMSLALVPTIFLTFTGPSATFLAGSIAIMGGLIATLWVTDGKTSTPSHLELRAGLLAFSTLLPLIAGASRDEQIWVASLVSAVAVLSIVFLSDLIYALAVVCQVACVMGTRIFCFGSLNVEEAVLLFLVLPMLSVVLRMVYKAWRTAVIEENQLREQIAVLKDVTTRQLGVEEARRRESVIQLHQAQKAESLELFAGSVANSFNNSLMAIIGYAESIKGRATDSKTSDEAAKVEEVAIRAARICKQMLDFARRDSDKKEPVMVGEMIEELATLLEPSIPTNVDLVIKEPDSSVCILASPGQIKQLVNNLILNAIDALPEKNGEIRIESAHYQHGVSRNDVADVEVGHQLLEGEYGRVSVIDNGCGMDEIDLPRIFDPYFTTRDDRNGFGLSIASAIATTNNGAMRVYSTPGKGTKVDVIIPLGALDVTESSTPNVTGMRIGGNLLIVDDDPQVLDAVSKMVEAHGWETTGAENGTTAIKLVRERGDSFSAIILDYSMPDMNGDEVLRKIRADGCETPVVLCTGMPEARYEDVVHQPNAYLRKPYHLRTLQKTIETIVQQLDSLDQSDES